MPGRGVSSGMVCSSQLHLEGPFPLDVTSHRDTQGSGERNLRDVTFPELWRGLAAPWVWLWQLCWHLDWQVLWLFL